MAPMFLVSPLDESEYKVSPESRQAEKSTQQILNERRRLHH